MRRSAHQGSPVAERDRDGGPVVRSGAHCRLSAPALIWAIRLVTSAIVLSLTLAVLRTRPAPAMTSGQVAWARLGASDLSHPLLGPALLTVWQLDPVAIVLVTVVAGWYLTSLIRARRHGPWPVRRAIAFAAGLAVCVLVTCGAVGVYDMALFSAHMIGHLAFVMVAPALLMSGRPLELALQASSPHQRDRLRSITGSRIAYILTAPPVALASYAAVIVGSHLTGLMDVIMRNAWAGQLEHLVYVVVGCQFFILILGDAPICWRLSTPARWLLLALAMAVDTFVGVVIMQGSVPVAMTAVPGLGVSALSDTHTGGAIMWFGGDAIMAAIMILLVLGWLRDPARQQLDSRGWLEQARRASFAERVGIVSDREHDLNFDIEDEPLAAYNSWLAAINHEAPP